MIKRLSFAVLLVFALLVTHHGAAADKKTKPFIAEPVSSKQSIRFYKANKELQADRVIITADKASNLGCNNFLKKVRVFKALQIGFQSCHLYEKKNCAVGSVVPVNSEKQERHTYILTEGQAWFVQDEDERGADVRSWSCGMALEEGELRVEMLLANREATRINSDRKLAKRKLDKAQAVYDQTVKDVKESRRYKKLVKSEAVAKGVIEEEEEVEEDEGEQNKNDKSANENLEN